MTYGELMEMVVGEGGQSVEWFWNLQQLKLAELVVKGVQRRYRAQWETSRMMARSMAAVWVKNLPEEYPCGRFPWEEPEHGRTGEADEATRETEMENANAVMDAMLKRAMAAKDGSNETLERDGEKDD